MLLRFLLVVILLGSWSASVDSATRLGLITTAEEKAMWQARMTDTVNTINGFTYASIYQNRLLAHANSFRSQSHPGGDGFWAGYTGTGCVPYSNGQLDWIPSTGGTGWGKGNGGWLARAAFVYLLTGDATYATPVETELLRLSNPTQTPGVDFGNTAKWCRNTTSWHSTPSVYVAPWLLRVALAYDFLLAAGYPGLTASEKTQINTWLFNAADWFRAGIVQATLPSSWSHKGILDTSPTYGCTGSWCTQVEGAWYLGGPSTRTATRYQFFNISASVIHLVGTIGVQQNNAALIDMAKKYFIAYIRVGTFDNGAQADFARWADCPGTCPGSMWVHQGAAMGPLIQTADIMARNGDTSLYDYAHAADVPGGSGGTVSLETMVELMARMASQTTQLFSYSGSTQLKLLSYNTETTLGMYNDFASMAANMYYQNATVTAAMERLTGGNNSNTGGQGCYESQYAGCFAGTWAFWPDLPFMYGNMEGIVNPYTATGPSAPSCTITSPTTLGTYNTATSPLATLIGEATDPDGTLGAGSITWACPQCTPTSGTADGTTSWSETDIGLTDNADNIITVTVTDADTPANTGTCQLTVHYDSTPNLTGLVAYWPLDDVAGGFQDATGEGHTATPSGTITRVVGADGTGGAVQFDGATGSLTATGMLGFSAADPDITLAAKVKRTATGQGNGEVLSLGNTVALRVSATQAVGFFYTGTGWSVLTAALPDDTSWHHVAYTAVAGAQKLYVDGVLVATGTHANAPSYTGLGNALVIGTHGTGVPGFWLAGTVDEARVYNRVLDGTDIAALVGTGTVSDEALHLPMNEGSDGTTTDTSVNAVTGTLTNATWSAGRLGGAGLQCAAGGTCLVSLSGSVVYAPSASPWSVAYWGNLTAWPGGDATLAYPTPLALRNNLTNPLSLWYSGDTLNTCDGIAFAQGSSVKGRWVVSAASLLGWHHVVLTYNGGGVATLANYTLYVDGVARTLTTTPCGGGGTQTSRLMLDSDGGAADQWIGQVDEVIVYTKALNQAEVTALASLSNPPTCTIITPASTPFAVDVSPYTALAGSAADETAVQTLTWLNAATSSGGPVTCGTCPATAPGWTVSSVPLVDGPNLITVTAQDGEGQQGTCQVRLDYTPPPPPPVVGMFGAPQGLTFLP